jgi:hypothetical protein
MLTLKNKQINSDKTRLDLEFGKRRLDTILYNCCRNLNDFRFRIGKASSGSVMDNIAEGFEETEI